MLTGPERNDVVTALTDALAAQPAQALIATIFLVDAGEILDDVPIGVTPDVIAGIVVNSCLVSRWQRNPALLEALVGYLIDTRGIGRFAAVLQRIRDRIDPNPSQYDTTWLFERRPFVDRAGLRGCVQDLIEQSGRPILRVIPRPGGYGRSYSRVYFEHLEDRGVGPVQVVTAVLEAGNGPSYQVADLLDTVSGQLGVAEPLPERTSSNFPQTAARWLLRQLMMRPGRWLLVFDHFGQDGLNPEVADTISALAVMVPTGQYRRRIRLALLDYPAVLEGSSAADIMDEELRAAADISIADLVPCVAAWNEQRRAQGRDALPDAGLQKVAGEILAKAPPAGRDRLCFINSELAKLQAMT